MIVATIILPETSHLKTLQLFVKIFLKSFFIQFPWDYTNQSSLHFIEKWPQVSNGDTRLSPKHHMYSGVNQGSVSSIRNVNEKVLLSS